MHSFVLLLSSSLCSIFPFLINSFLLFLSTYSPLYLSFLHIRRYTLPFLYPPIYFCPFLTHSFLRMSFPHILLSTLPFLYTPFYFCPFLIHSFLLFPTSYTPFFSSFLHILRSALLSLYTPFSFLLLSFPHTLISTLVLSSYTPFYSCPFLIYSVLLFLSSFILKLTKLQRFLSSILISTLCKLSLMG